MVTMQDFGVAGPKPTPVFVYNPDDEPDRHAFNGTVFDLAPNQTTDVAALLHQLRSADPQRWSHITAEAIADHLVAELGKFGVCRTQGPVLLGKVDWLEDEQVVKEAERVYESATRAWAQDLALAYSRAAKPYVDAGLDGPKMTDQEKKAHQWLHTHPALMEDPLS